MAQLITQKGPFEALPQVDGHSSLVPARRLAIERMSYGFTVTLSSHSKKLL